MMFEFKNIDYLTDKEIDLVIEQKLPQDDNKGYLPSYKYNITLHKSQEVIGKIDIRIGFNENIYYGGNIGYMVYEEYRGNNYAYKACKLIKQVAIAHKMSKLDITCNPDNIPSRKTCEKLGLILEEIVDLPEDNEMYKEGERKKCRYVWHL